MSAELLRRAASLMRERAETATPGPWDHLGDHLVWPSEKGPAANDPILAMVGEAHEDTAPHIASWHPAVALAVADWLDHAAQYATWRQHIGDGPTADMIDRAEATARAYLGES